MSSLSTRQQGAITFAIAKIAAGIPAVITGPAGSGKTTILIELMRTLHDAEALASSNKAVQRIRQLLRENGLQRESKTFHSAFLKPERSNSSKIRGVHTPGGAQENIDFVEADKFVEHPVYGDEVGMLDSSLLEPLLNYAQGGLILMGDERQLLPVGSKKSVLQLAAERFGKYELTEIFRQSEGSTSECLKSLVADGNIDDAIAMLPTVSLDEAVELAATGIPIIGAQHRKHLVPLNAAVREYRGLGEWPEKGEVLLVRKGGDLSMYNGGWKLSTNEEVTVDRPISDPVSVTYSTARIFARQYMVKDAEEKKQRLLVFHIPGNDEEVERVLGIFNGEWVVDNRGPANDNDSAGDKVHPMTVIQREVKQETGVWSAYCDVADSYARTCHSTQGSEWNNVVVVPEAIGDRRRWLYTAISRAKKQAFILKGQE